MRQVQRACAIASIVAALCLGGCAGGPPVTGSSTLSVVWVFTPTTLKVEEPLFGRRIPPPALEPPSAEASPAIREFLVTCHLSFENCCSARRPDGIEGAKRE